MKFTSKMVSNSFYAFLDWSFVAFISFLFWFFVNKNLQPEQSGIIFTFANTAILLSNIAIFGLGTALFKLIPEYFAKRQFKKISNLIKFSFKVAVLILSVISLILLIFSNQLSSILKINQLVFILLIITTIILTFSNFFSNILFGFQNFKRIFTTDAYGSIVKILAVISLLYLGFSYFGPLIALMLGFFVVMLFRLNTKFFRKGHDGIDKKQVIFVYALPAFISTLASVILSNGHYIILTVIKNLDITGKYGVAMSLASPILLIPSILSAALFPIISQLGANKNFKRNQSHLINLTLRYVLLIGFPLLSFLILFSKPIILIYSSQKFLPAAQLYPILAISSFIYGIGTIYFTSLYAIGKPKIYRNIIVLSSSLFLFLSILLTYLYSSIGLAVAYFISISVLSVSSYFFIRKYIKTIFNYPSLVKIIIANLFFISLVYFSDLISVALFLKVLLVGIAGIIYLLILVPLRFYTKDDIDILNFLEFRSPKNLKKVFSLSRQIISKYV